MSRDRERGAAMVAVALSLVVLLIIVAFVVDIGAQRLTRRQAQTAADAAALAAVRILADGGTRVDAATAAIRLTWENTKERNAAPTLADWQLRWATCTDPGRPAEYSITAASPVATPCISFTADNTQVRVTLPALSVQTTFAGVMGVRSLSTAAFAEARSAPGGGGSYAVFGASMTCADPPVVDLHGGTHIVNGRVHSNNSIKSAGGANVPDGVTHRGTYTNDAGPTAADAGTTGALADPLAALSMGQYRAGGSLRTAAMNAGVWRDFSNLTVDNAAVLASGDGVYYTTRNVDLKTEPSLAGVHASFIIDNPSPPPDYMPFATNGTGYDLRYYSSDTANPHKLLIYTNATHGCATADKASIDFNGSSGHWEGVLYAPNGSIHLNGSGSGVDLLGAAVAQTVLLDGTGHRLNNPGDFLAGDPSAQLFK